MTFPRDIDGKTIVPVIELNSNGTGFAFLSSSGDSVLAHLDAPVTINLISGGSAIVLQGARDATAQPWFTSPQTSAGVWAQQAGTWNITTTPGSAGTTLVQQGLRSSEASSSSPWFTTITQSVGVWAQQAGIWNITTTPGSAGTTIVQQGLRSAEALASQAWFTAEQNSVGTVLTSRTWNLTSGGDSVLVHLDAPINTISTITSASSSILTHPDGAPQLVNQGTNPWTVNQTASVGVSATVVTPVLGNQYAIALAPPGPAIPIGATSGGSNNFPAGLTSVSSALFTAPFAFDRLNQVYKPLGSVAFGNASALEVEVVSSLVSFNINYNTTISGSSLINGNGQVVAFGISSAYVGLFFNGIWTGTVVIDAAMDGASATLSDWYGPILVFDVMNQVWTYSISNSLPESGVGNGNQIRLIQIPNPGGIQGIRVRSIAWTSGSLSAQVFSTPSLNGPNSWTASSAGGTASPYADLVGGTDGTNLRPFLTDTLGQLKVLPTSSAGVFAQQAGAPWSVSGSGNFNVVPQTSAGVFSQQAGTWTVQQGGSPWGVTPTTSAGTFAQQAGTWNIGTLTSITQSVGVSASQSGTWTVQPGNTQNTTPWLTSDSTSAGVSASQAGTWNINTVTAVTAITQSTGVGILSDPAESKYNTALPAQAILMGGSSGSSFTTSVIQAPNVTAVPLQGTTSSTGGEFGLTTRSRQYFGNKPTYSAAGVTSVGVPVGRQTSISYLFHPATDAKRYQLNRVRVSASNASGGQTFGSLIVNLNRITAEAGTPGGTTFTPQPHDPADPASSATFRQGANGTPVRGATTIRIGLMNLGSNTEFDYPFSDAFEGKPLICRSGTAEGWEVSIISHSASGIPTGTSAAASFVWTEELPTAQ